MHIKTLKLNSFRNYESLNLELPNSPKPIILTGQNGAGKTNILEAISLLVPGRGIRGAKTPEICKHAAKFQWSIYSEAEGTLGNVEIGTGFDTSGKSEKRIVKIDGEKQRGQAVLSQHIAICSLTPSMDQTFNLGTTSRREYLDKLANAFFPEHARHMAIYDNAKSERRKVLRNYNSDEIWLNTLERRMAEQAVAIAVNRIETISHLQKAIDDSGDIFTRAVLSPSGMIEDALSNHSALDVEDYTADQLSNARLQDKENGRTNFGTHKSDFSVYHKEKQMPAELCSTGEQKSLLLSITMAAAKARKNFLNSTPIILLDEVVAHLDEEKRKAFFIALRELGAQSWLTGTEQIFFQELKDEAEFFEVENGKCVESVLT